MLQPVVRRTWAPCGQSPIHCSWDRRDRLSAEWLPAYAPELNPDEQVWNRAQYVDLANFIPEDLRHLGRAVLNNRCCTRSSTMQNYLDEHLVNYSKINRSYSSMGFSDPFGISFKTGQSSPLDHK